MNNYNKKSSVFLEGNLGRHSNNGLNDTKNVKTALNKLGYYKPPEWGITEYSDDEMFDGIERFQKDNKLKQPQNLLCQEVRRMALVPQMAELKNARLVQVLVLLVE